MTWRESAYANIEQIGRDFTPEMTLKEKRKILCRAGESFSGGAKFPRKAWSLAQREYLERFHGQPKGYGKRKIATPLLPTAEQMDRFEKKGTLL